MFRDDQVPAPPPLSHMGPCSLAGKGKEGEALLGKDACMEAIRRELRTCSLVFLIYSTIESI